MKLQTRLIGLILFLFVCIGNAAATTLYYSAWTGSGSTIYRIDGGTGSDLLLITAPTVNFNDLAASPIIDTIYAIDINASTGCLHTINVTTHADQLVGCAGIGIRQIGYDGTHGVLYGTNNSSLYSIDVSTGAATLIGSFGGPTNMKALTYDGGTNLLYGVDDSTLSLYTINVGTGAATLVGTTGPLTPNIYDVYVDPGTGQMFGIGSSGSSPSFFSINKTTGVASLVKSGIADYGLGLAAPLFVGSMSIPTLSEWGMILLSGLVALAAFATSRRRRM